MSRTLKPVNFFSDEITIRPHTATSVGDLDRDITIREFANGHPVRLYQYDDGEYHAERAVYPPVFITGPEVCHE